MNKAELELGELLDEFFDFKHIIWKIPNVLSLPRSADIKVQSPEFSLAGATWNLGMYPTGRTWESSQGHIDLMIYRLNSPIPEQHVFYKLYFKTRHGKEFESFSDSGCFNSDCNGRGVRRYMAKSRFMAMKNVIAPNGVLTIICEMRTKKISEMDRYPQVESIASLLESPKERSEQEPYSSTAACKESAKERFKQEPESSLFASKALPVNKMVHDFKELFLKQEDCDVFIKVKGKEFPAHKTILIARSPVFASTFRNEMKEKATGIVDIEDCEPSSFSDFLFFLYCGYLENLSTENVYSLFTAADKYDVQDLRVECLEFMKKNLSVDTFCDVVTLALQHFEKELIELATDFFAKHFQEIIVTVKWQSFVVENPIQSNEIMIKSFVSNKK